MNGVRSFDCELDGCSLIMAANASSVIVHRDIYWLRRVQKSNKSPQVLYKSFQNVVLTATKHSWYITYIHQNHKHVKISGVTRGFENSHNKG